MRDYRKGQRSCMLVNVFASTKSVSRISFVNMQSWFIWGTESPNFSISSFLYPVMEIVFCKLRTEPLFWHQTLTAFSVWAFYLNLLRYQMSWRTIETPHGSCKTVPIFSEWLKSFITLIDFIWRVHGKHSSLSSIKIIELKHYILLHIRPFRMPRNTIFWDLFFFDWSLLFL